jgi:hypothetical protein
MSQGVVGRAAGVLYDVTVGSLWRYSGFAKVLQRCHCGGNTLSALSVLTGS